MLPSTGYFKKLNCPFYDSGLCERPYCHFRHVKKDSQGTPNDGMESGAILQKLVSAAVQRVLQQSDNASSPSSVQPETADEVPVAGAQPVTTKATYNPTPISKLNKMGTFDSDSGGEENLEQRKRHIPVPYTPRKPSNIPITRPLDTNGSTQTFIYIAPVKYTPGGSGTAQLDLYTPKGGTESGEKYLPGSEKELQEYSPSETQTSRKRSYVPSERNSTKNKVLEYKPAKVSVKCESATITYQPTLKSLAPCFSSDEDEPEPKKRELTNDLNGLDELGPEFDILDQILDEEKVEEKVIKNNLNVKETNKEKSKEDKKTRKKHDDKRDSKENRKKDDKKDSKENKVKDDEDKKEKSTKHESKKSHDKSKSERKDKHSSRDKEQHSSKSKSSGHKSDKSSSKDKEKKNDKHNEKEKHHSSSKHSDKSSERKSSSKSRQSKHSDSTKSDSKHREKSHKSTSQNSHKRKNQREEKSIDINISDDDSTNDVEIIPNEEELYEISESDEEAIALECKKIFEEYVPEEKNSMNCEEKNNHIDNVVESEYVPGKKRISRTAGKEVKVLSKAPLKPNFKVSAAQTMSERLSKIKEFHASKATESLSENEKQIIKPDVSKNSYIPTNSSKVRIAHVPYASTLLSAKKTITPATNVKKVEPSTSSTTIQTVKRGAQRVAHIPNEKFVDRPGVLEPLASKIPANIRSTYLNTMIDECLKIYLTATDAYARAQHEELTTSKKCSTIQIYKNSAALTVTRLRKELQECNGIKKCGTDCTTLQKIPQSVTGTGSNSGSWSIESKNKRIVDNSNEFKGAKFYNNIKKWLLTEQQLLDNGFPRPHPSGQKGKAVIFGQNKQKPPKGLIRTCCRCKKDYTIDKKGFPAVQEDCIYHPNNKYRIRGEVKYQCCSQDGFSDGCCIASCHVYEYVDFENLRGFVKTLAPEIVMDDYGVYSLDCEMCYTTHGLDLTRVTVINSDCRVVYETLIKPLHPIMDYNTRYSGITAEQMAEVKTTLLEVQATLLTMFNSKTILIGHSLESDFKALKLIHDTVIDTSVLFPHKMGPPFKRALRNLSSEYLKKIIQNSVDGHDSAEDATVCMELIIYKLKEDLKSR